MRAAIPIKQLLQTKRWCRYWPSIISKKSELSLLYQRTNYHLNILIYLIVQLTSSSLALGSTETSCSMFLQWKYFLAHWLKSFHYSPSVSNLSAHCSPHCWRQYAIYVALKANQWYQCLKGSSFCWTQCIFCQHLTTGWLTAHTDTQELPRITQSATSGSTAGSLKDTSGSERILQGRPPPLH